MKYGLVGLTYNDPI